jgi:ABC-type Mn2+/Zn2+ transport system permease subunit
VLEMFEPAFMRLALVASIATGASLGLMGVYLVFRRVAFMGLVLANAATVGAALAELLGWNLHITSIAATVLAAPALGTIPVNRRIPAESVMSWGYAAASSATVLILARAAAADTDTLHLLFGNLLAVSFRRAIELVIIALTVGVIHILFTRRFLLVSFDPDAARVAGVHTSSWTLFLNLTIGIAVAAAVHEIGALLTFTLLTLPPMAALLLMQSIRGTFIMSAGLGTALACLGLVISFHFDLPAGPASVALLAVGVLAAFAVSRRRH